MTASLPLTEGARLAALRAHDVLDTAPELAFDDITLLAAEICGVPIAAVSLIDESRQWFKSIVGLDVRETSRDAAFCAHTILQAGLMMVPDAEADPRFADNPLVTGEPHIRFYAGTPLVTPDGHALGSLCVIDRVPRTLTPAQQAALAALGRQVAGQLALRRVIAERDQAQGALREFADQLHTTVEAMQEGLVLQNADGIIQVCNPAAERILGLSASQMLGRSSRDPRWHTVREDGSPFPADEHPAMQSLRTGEPVRDVLMGVHRPGGELVWLSVNASPLLRPGETRPYAAVATFQDVTERKQADEARARLAAIVDSSHDAITAMTLDGTLVSWNPGAERMYGYAPDEVIGNHGSVLAGPGQSSPVPDAIHRLQHGEDVPPMEVVRRRKDGAPMDVLLTFTPIRGAAGEMVGVAATARDISAQKRVDAAVRRSEARLAEAQRVAHLGNWEFNVATGQVSWSDELYRIYGRDPAHGVPTNDEVAAMYHPDDIPRRQAEMARALAQGVPFECDRRVITPDGTVKFVHTIGAPVFGEGGQVVGLFGIVADVTERKAMEETLRASQRFAESITNHSTSIIFVFDLDTMSNVYSNRNVGEFLGYSVAQVQAMGRDLLSIMLHPEDLPRVQSHFGQFADKADGEVIEMEYRARHASGEWRWIWNREVVFKRRPDGTPCQIMGTAQDITARKRDEEAVRQAEQQVRDYAVVLEAKMRELEAVNEELERLATTDGLTGLMNHRTFQERLRQEFTRATRYGTPLSLLLLDVDHFKQFNDTFGHPAGDAVLKSVSQVLRMTARHTDLVARYGGEEFVLVLPQTDSHGATVIAERVRVAIAAASWDLRAVTVSIGVSTLALDTPDPSVLIARADQALYHSKAAGRDRVTHGQTPTREAALV